MRATFAVSMSQCYPQFILMHLTDSNCRKVACYGLDQKDFQWHTRSVLRQLQVSEAFNSGGSLQKCLMRMLHEVQTHHGPTSSVADSPIGRGCIGTNRLVGGDMILITAVSVKGSDPTSSPFSTSRFGNSSEPDPPVAKKTICRSCGPMSLTTWKFLARSVRVGMSRP